MCTVMVLILNYIHFHLCGLFPLITFVVDMMYLQIIYQCEALQMPKTLNKKHFDWLVNKGYMASQIVLSYGG